MNKQSRQLRQMPGRKNRLLVPHRGGNRLKKVREAFRIALTMRDVALSVGMSPSRYGDLEAGASVKLDTARRIAAVLETTVDTLWPIEVTK